MALEKKIKQQIIEEFKVNKEDRGSIPVQIALLTERIEYLTNHLKEHKKDFHSKRGLLHLVNKRRKLFNYLERKSPVKYQELKAKLKLK